MIYDENELGMRRLLSAPTGPVMSHIFKLAEHVERNALSNTSGGGEFPASQPGEKVRYVSGVLHDNIQVETVFRAREPYIQIGSTGTKGGFAYPTYLETTGWNWLTGALRRVFPEGG